jgi:hypothetical protein
MPARTNPKVIVGLLEKTIKSFEGKKTGTVHAVSVFFLFPSEDVFVPHFVPRWILGTKKGLRKHRNPLYSLVELVGIEPTTS